MRARAVAVIVGTLLAAALPAQGDGAEADATCWNFFQGGQWHRLCYEATDQRASDQDCAPAGDFEVCVAGTHQTSTSCGLPTSPFQVTCTVRYVGFVVGNGTLPGTAAAQAETWDDTTTCSWPDAVRASPFQCAAGTLTARSFTVEKGTCVETPRAWWRAEAASWFFGARAAVTEPLEAWSTLCAW